MAKNRRPEQAHLTPEEIVAMYGRGQDSLNSFVDASNKFNGVSSPTIFSTLDPVVTSSSITSPFLQQPVVNTNNVGPTISNAKTQQQAINTSKNAKYNSQVDKIEEMYAAGKMNDTQYSNALNRVKVRYEGPGTSQATSQAAPQQKPVQFSMDDFETADEINAMENVADDIADTTSNTFDFSGYDAQQSTKTVGDIEYSLSGEGYKVNIKNNAFGNIEIDDMTYKIEDNQLFNMTTNAPIEGDELARVQDVLRRAEKDYYKNLTNREWKRMAKNPEYFGFPENTTKEQILQTRKKIWSDEINDLTSQSRKEGIPKKEFNEIQDQLNKARVKEAEVDKFIDINTHKKTAKQQRASARAKFNKAIEGIDPNSAGYAEAYEQLKTDYKYIRSNYKGSVKHAENKFKGMKKGYTGKGLSPMKVFNAGFSIKMGIDKYKEERAEGKNIVSSAAQGLGSVAVAEMLGPVGQIAYEVAKAAPAAIMTGADALYKEHRRMNSASNFRPLGGVNYQDTQELATMRQSGMELAKMSQYNLEQALMGAEAKHLHR